MDKEPVPESLPYKISEEEARQYPERRLAFRTERILLAIAGEKIWVPDFDSEDRQKIDYFYGSDVQWASVQEWGDGFNIHGHWFDQGETRLHHLPSEIEAKAWVEKLVDGIEKLRLEAAGE